MFSTRLFNDPHSDEQTLPQSVNQNNNGSGNLVSQHGGSAGKVLATKA